MLISYHFLKSILTWQLLISSTSSQSTTIASTTASRSTRSLRPSLSTELVFAPWAARLSVVAVDPTATTYLYNNSNPLRNNNNTSLCHPEAVDRITIVNGPSTAGVTYIYTSCGTNPAYSGHLACPLTAPNTATCDLVSAGDNNQLSTKTLTQNSSELSGQPCTITAGLEKLTARTAVTVLTTSGEESAVVPQTTMPTANSTGSPSRSSAAPSQSSVQGTSDAQISFIAFESMLGSVVMATTLLSIL